MLPLISPKDKITIASSTKFEVDDVVVFYRDGRLTAHRIIYQSPDRAYFVTKGDNNLKSDGKIRKNQILGKIANLSPIYLSQSISYLEELTKLCQVIANQKIKYVILKGLPVRLFFEEKPPQRLYLDADILIDKGSFTKSADILTNLGFREVKSEVFGQEMKNSLQVNFIKNTKPFPVVIDLHIEAAVGFTKIPELNRLLGNYAQITRFFLNSGQKVKENGKVFSILKKEALLLYLLLHLFHHNFQGSHRMQFIDALARTQNLDWNKITRDTKKLRIQSLIFPAAAIVKKYYQTPFSDKFIKSISSKLGVRLISLAISGLISPFDKGSRNCEAFKRFIFLLLLSGASFSTKIKTIVYSIKFFFFSTFTKSSKSFKAVL